jgi:outer membrane protein assembly factor BamB
MNDNALLWHTTETSDGEKIWYIAELTGFVVEVDIATKTQKCIWWIPRAFMFKYRSIYYHDGKLYIFPFNGEDMYVLDIKTLEYKSLHIKPQLRFIGGIKRENFLYVFGWTSQLIKYNLENDDVEYITINPEKCGMKVIPDIWFWNECCLKDGNIYIKGHQSNLVIVIDKSDNISSVYLGEEPQSWIAKNFAVCNDKFYAIFCKGKVDDLQIFTAEYDMSGKLISQNYIDNHLEYHRYPFISSFFLDRKWLCLPFGRSEVVLTENQSENIIYTIEDGTKYIDGKVNRLFNGCVLVDNYLYSINQAMGSLLSVDINDLSVSHSKLKVEEGQEDAVKMCFEQAVREGDIVLYETSECLSLEVYLTYICES